MYTNDGLMKHTTNPFLRLCSAVILLAVSLALGGCELGATTASEFMPLGLSPVATVMGADAVSVVNSQKTLGDHLFSHMTKMECSSPKAMRDGGDYCRPKQQKPAPQPMVYCYRTMANPTCYAVQNPTGYGTRIGSGY